MNITRESETKKSSNATKICNREEKGEKGRDSTWRYPRRGFSISAKASSCRFLDFEAETRVSVRER